MKSTTIEIPIDLRNRLQRLKRHPRQAYHEVIEAALARAETAENSLPSGQDPILARHRSAILRLARQHGLGNVRVFGSRARGDARPDSDLDLVYDLQPGHTLLDVAAFARKLEALIGVTVHPTEEPDLRSPMRERVLAEARLLA
ncbi:MAG TPA: nucleotidyltransferase domain-containing protein [Candidatus Thermoplasmatota archaeon]|nr:nucleotidyltransferase domain-containing protein [Candidatus Thermoplasmatota archaeon]